MMKETDAAVSDKVYDNLQHSQEVVDRNTVMIYEKRFRDRYKKLGNVNQRCPYCSKEYRSLSIGEKSCMQCKKLFLIGKRVQDMNTVVYQTELREHFNLQWKVIGGVKKFQYYTPSEFEYIHRQLEKQGKKNLRENDIMQSLLSAYAKNSLSAGHYRLYAAFLFYKAELMRSEQRFAEAMTYYFYVHFLHTNGVCDTAELGIHHTMNSELKERMGELVDLGNFQIKKMKNLYEYAIISLNRFDMNRLKMSLNRSYDLLVKEFRQKDEEKEGIKPMRSFVLYTRAS